MGASANTERFTSLAPSVCLPRSFFRDGKGTNITKPLSTVMQSSLTIKFRGAEAELLDRLVRTGLFATKSEAVRAALVRYGADLGLLRAQGSWSPPTGPRRRTADAAGFLCAAYSSEEFRCKLPIVPRTQGLLSLELV